VEITSFEICKLYYLKLNSSSRGGTMPLRKGVGPPPSSQVM
jgi:hypothetical protein